MLPLSHYEQARRDAEFHVQVEIRHVQRNVATPGQARVDANVIRIFRGQHALKLGDAVRFVVSVLTGNESLDNVPIGGTIWTNYNNLPATRFLEVFLDGLPPECAVALWQLSIIDSLSDLPHFDCMPHVTRKSHSGLLNFFRRILVGRIL